MLCEFNERLNFLVELMNSNFNVLQHVDSPDNNPDLPWEFSEPNKKKVGVLNALGILGFLAFLFRNGNVLPFIVLGYLNAYQIHILLHLACLMTLSFRKMIILLI